MRAHLLLEQVGLGSAVDFQLLERVVAGRLWLPFALIEIGFRNAVDRVLTSNHTRGENWFLSTGAFSGSALPVAAITGAASLCVQDDPIAAAAQMAGEQLGKPSVSRDDVVAHLMFGFWIQRCPSALSPEPETKLWDLLLGDLVAIAHAQGIAQPAFSDAGSFRDTMISLNRLRNRIAHHEPLIVRTRDVFAKNGSPRPDLVLMPNLERALVDFWKHEDLALDAARTIAPFAAKQIEDTHAQLELDLSSFKTRLTAVHADMRAARDARKLAARAKFAGTSTAMTEAAPTQVDIKPRPS